MTLALAAAASSIDPSNLLVILSADSNRESTVPSFASEMPPMTFSIRAMRSSNLAAAAASSSLVVTASVPETATTTSLSSFSFRFCFICETPSFTISDKPSCSFFEPVIIPSPPSPPVLPVAATSSNLFAKSCATRVISLNKRRLSSSSSSSFDSSFGLPTNSEPFKSSSTSFTSIRNRVKRCNGVSAVEDVVVIILVVVLPP
mmetsp:Transcript_46638/g.68933  ORF Transcript_46638/g.68933 Transcript_46638/m.68933 type:complete len:203 (-) Transcript_46638:148-756(-)